MKNIKLVMGFFLCLVHMAAQDFPSNTKLSDPMTMKIDHGMLHGTLSYLNSDHPTPLVIFISGSGPTDRDGNQNGLGSDCFKMLADALLDHEIASLRFDKRGVGESTFDPEKFDDVVFMDFVNDIKLWISRYSTDPRFSKIVVMGHSLGSLMGTVAVQDSEADGFISLAGPGKSIVDLIYWQLQQQMGVFAQGAKPTLDSIAQGYDVQTIDPMLERILPKKVHHYLYSVNQFDPAEEIAKVDLPVQIICGSHDVQVSLDNSERLSEFNPSAELVIIEGMNHVLKDAPKDRAKNIMVYDDKTIALNAQITGTIAEFVLSLNQ